MQIDSLNELPQEKRPPESMIWDGTAEDIESWLERVFEKKEKQTATIVIDDIEG